MAENVEFSFAMVGGVNGLPRIQTHGSGKKAENGICHDDSATPVKAQTIDELHSLQKKRSAPTTPIKDGSAGAAAFATISEEDRQILQLQSIRSPGCTWIASNRWFELGDSRCSGAVDIRWTF